MSKKIEAYESKGGKLFKKKKDADQADIQELREVKHNALKSFLASIHGNIVSVPKTTEQLEEDFFLEFNRTSEILDLVGNVWQLTNDVYDNGSYYFVIIRGGSYYNPTSSWWYVQGGPQQLDKTQMLLMVSPGFDRNATVGFRCVKDAK